MALQLTSAQVWQEIEKELFAVIGMVTAKHEARTVGIPLMQMRDPDKSRGRAPVDGPEG